MARRVIYDPSPTQEAFHISRALRLLMLGGKGSGKTFSLGHKALYLAGINRGVDGAILCPTLKMFKRDVLPSMRKTFKENRIPYHYNKSDFEFEFPLSENRAFVYHSEDEGESIAGSNLGWAVINEVTLCKFLAYAELVSRVRDANAVLPQIAMSGTPEDLAWVHEELLGKEGIETYFISTRENKHLGDWYIKALEETYDKKRQEAYIDGKPVMFTGGRAAWSFDRTKHHAILNFDPMEIWVTLDFNVAPFGATVWFIPDHDTRARLELDAYARFEVNIPEDATTPKFCDALWEALHERKLAEKKIVLFPDPAGKNRGTRSDYTDMEILDQAGFKDVRYKKSIISVKQCLNSYNNQLDKGRFKVHPDCKELTKDNERCKLKEGTFEIDKRDIKRSHWLDGAKNMSDYEFPIINPNVKASVSRG